MDGAWLLAGGCVAAVGGTWYRPIMLLWRYMPTFAWLVTFPGACDLSRRANVKMASLLVAVSAEPTVLR